MVENEKNVHELSDVWNKSSGSPWNWVELQRREGSQRGPNPRTFRPGQTTAPTACVWPFYISSCVRSWPVLMNPANMRWTISLTQQCVCVYVRARPRAHCLLTDAHISFNICSRWWTVFRLLFMFTNKIYRLLAKNNRNLFSVHDY